MLDVSAAKKTRRAKVTFSYAADNADELSLQPGQVSCLLLLVVLTSFCGYVSQPICLFSFGQFQNG